MMEGHSVIVESNKDRALLQAQQCLPALIVLACPDFHDICDQFIEEVRENPEIALTPVLLLSNIDQSRKALVYKVDSTKDLVNEIAKFIF